MVSPWSMASRENAVIGVSMVVAIAATYAVATYADAPNWASAAVLIAVGVVVPTLINQYLDGRVSG